MASFRCYDISDVIATLITTNFHLYLIQLWWQFFQMLVYGDVVYAQTWQVLTLKNCIEPFMPVRPMLLHRPSFLFDSFVKIWAIWKNFWANVLPPPLAKNSPYAYGDWCLWKPFVPIHFSLDQNKRRVLPLAPRSTCLTQRSNVGLLVHEVRKYAIYNLQPLCYKMNPGTGDIEHVILI